MNLCFQGAFILGNYILRVEVLVGESGVDCTTVVHTRESKGTTKSRKYVLTPFPPLPPTLFFAPRVRGLAVFCMPKRVSVWILGMVRGGSRRDSSGIQIRCGCWGWHGEPWGKVICMGGKGARRAVGSEGRGTGRRALGCMVGEPGGAGVDGWR